MPVPPFQDLFLPFLHYAADGNIHSSQDVAKHLAEHFHLSEEDIAEMLPSGRQNRFQNRVAWAKSFLGKALLIEPTGRNRFCITQRGRDLLSTNPSRVDNHTLSQYAEFQIFRGKQSENGTSRPTELVTDPVALTPEEQLESAHQSIRDQLGQSLIAEVMKCSPVFFEKLVIDLLLAMGYGGSRSDAGEAVGKTADGGIDGIIKEDRLGLDIIYLQAKRWESTVGSPVVRDFVGSLVGHSAGKGVLITTSRFSREAQEYAKRVPQKIVLIDGDRLASLMVDFGIGVTDVASYTVKRMDADYFGLE